MIDSKGVNLSIRLLRNKNLKTSEKLVYAYLFSECGGVNRFCEKPIKATMADLNLGERTILHAFRTLTNLKLFEIKTGFGKNDTTYLFIAKDRIH